MILQSLSKLQRHGPLQISHEKEEKNNGAYGSRSHGGYKFDIDDTVRYGKLLDTPNRRGDGHRCYSCSSSDRHYDWNGYHPYRRRDRGYFLDDFKKSKPPTFNGETNKSQDAEAWLLGMRKFFILHDYSKNMKD